MNWSGNTSKLIRSVEWLLPAKRISRPRSVHPCANCKTTRRKSVPSTKSHPSNTPPESAPTYGLINIVDDNALRLGRHPRIVVSVQRDGDPLRRYRQPAQSIPPRFGAWRRRDRGPARHFAHRALPLREGRARENRDARKTRRAARGVGADAAWGRRRIHRLGPRLFRAHAPDRGDVGAHHRAGWADFLSARVRW